MFALFGLSQKVKWFLAQQKLSLEDICDVKPSGLIWQVQIKFGFSRGSVRTLDQTNKLSHG